MIVEPRPSGDPDATVSGDRPVLILGAGINGAAVARELLLNGESVVVVDRVDIAAGATSRSSRLIHGGLRYLEFGDFGLVRESLQERERLLQLAPQFVRPLRLYIPLRQRISGLVQSAFRFLGLTRMPLGGTALSLIPHSKQRGMWLVEVGLYLYDFLSRDGSLPAHQVFSSCESSVPQVDRKAFGWMCAYSDAQMIFPERFVVALLDDARRAARKNGISFRVFTHCHVELQDGKASVIPCDDQPDNLQAGPVAEFEPSVVINATGAAGDLTLGELHIPSKRLFGGTKGSHFLTYHQKLRAAIGDDGIYAEAQDGRLVFVLPFADEAILVGTTDERFEGNPEQAVATRAELDYLLSMVNEVFGDITLTREDVSMHYSGVRPLPFANSTEAASIPRGHWIDVNDSGPLPVLTLIGGKLTTCRALGEETADHVLKRLGRSRTVETASRVVPGGEDFPADKHALQERLQQLAERFALNDEQVRAIWALCGNRFDEIFNDGWRGLSLRGPVSPSTGGPKTLRPGTPIEEIFSEQRGESQENLAETQLPRSFIRWVIANEWVGRLEDLVERRLMLLFQKRLSRRTLDELAGLLIEGGLLATGQREQAVDKEIERLHRLYGKQVEDL